MIYAFFLLLVGVLPTVLIFYLVGVLLLKKLKLSKSALFLGFLSAWVLSALIALVFADSPTTQSALDGSFVSGVIGCVITLVGLSIAGKRTAPEQN